MSIDVVNALFNEKLRGLTPSNADSVILSLGRPGGVLLSAGVEDREIRLYCSKLLKKAKLHNFAPFDLMDLPDAINDPIAIFEDDSGIGLGGSHRILTRLKLKNDNLLVVIGDGKGTDAYLNIVYTIFGKPLDRIMRWINTGKLLYADKKKALDYLRTPAPLAGAISNREPLILGYLRTPALIAGAIDSQEFIIPGHPGTPAPIAGAVDNRGLTNTCHPRTPAPIAGAADGRELLEAIKTVAGFKNPVLTDKIIYLPENVNTQNTFSKKGGAHVCP